MEEKKYISLELARSIDEVSREIGFDLPSSEYTWVLCTESQKYKVVKLGSREFTNYYAMGQDGYDGEGDQYSQGFARMYRAYDLYELGKMLPAGIIQKRKKNTFHETAIDVSEDPTQLSICPIWSKGDKRYVLYLAGDLHYVKDDKEVDARGKMIRYLIKEKLIANQPD